MALLDYLASAVGGGLEGFQDYQRLQSLLEQRKSIEEDRKSRAEDRKAAEARRGEDSAIRNAQRRAAGIRERGEVDPDEQIRKPGTWLMQPKWQDLGGGYVQDFTSTPEYEGQEKEGETKKQAYANTMTARSLDPKLSLQDAFGIGKAAIRSPGIMNQMITRAGRAETDATTRAGLQGLLGKTFGGVTVDEDILDAMVANPQIMGNILRDQDRVQFPPTPREPRQPPSPGSQLNFAQDTAKDLVGSLPAIPELAPGAPNAVNRTISRAYGMWMNDPNRDKSLDEYVRRAITAEVNNRERARLAKEGTGSGIRDYMANRPQTP